MERSSSELCGTSLSSRIELDVAGGDFPHLERDAPLDDVDVDVEFFSLAVARRLQGQLVEVGPHVMRDLLAVSVDGLGEITLAVQHAHRHEGQAEVAGGLAVVAGQNAEAAGVNGQALVKTEFGAEIGDQILLGVQMRHHFGTHAFMAVGVVGGQGAVEVLDEHPVVGGGVEPRLRDAAQKGLGVVAALIPQFGIESHEQPAYPPVPAVK